MNSVVGIPIGRLAEGWVITMVKMITEPTHMRFTVGLREPLGREYRLGWLKGPRDDLVLVLAVGTLGSPPTRSWYRRFHRFHS